MAFCKYLGIFCVLVCFYQVLGDTDEPQILVTVDGGYIVGLGDKYDNAMLKLLGQVYKNFEHNMSIVKENTRIEFFLKKVCESSECDPWPEWPECPATEGHFEVVTRTRECGRNTSRCSYPNYRTESETTVCAGAITSVESEDPDQYACPPGYSDFNGFCLVLSDSSTTHSAARNDCVSTYGGVLVNVNSNEKQEALYALMDMHNFISSIWLDGVKLNAARPVEYTYGTSSTFDNWYTSEPVNQIFDPYTNQLIEHLCKADINSVPRSWMVRECGDEFGYVCEYISE